MRRAILLISVLILAAVAATIAYQVIRDRDYRALLAKGDAALRADQTF